VAAGLLGIAALVALVVAGGLLSRPAAPGGEQPRANTLGQAAAPLLVEEWEDVQCPACRRAALTTPAELEPFIAGGRVRLAVRHLPFQGEASARAAEATECAGDQGRFFDYRRLLDTADPARGPVRFSGEALKGYAAELGLDAGAFGACLDSGRYRGRVLADLEAARRLGLESTPTFIAGGERIVGLPRAGELRALIERRRGG
jgi:protein-disulfide isomerase